MLDVEIQMLQMLSSIVKPAAMALWLDLILTSKRERMCVFVIRF